MSVGAIHGLYGVQLGTTVLGGITQQSAALASTVRPETSSGSVFAQFQSLSAQNPTIDWTTLAIAAALGVVPFDSANVAKSIAALDGGISVYGHLHAEGGTRAPGSAHRKYTAAKGIVYSRTLTVSHQQDAQLTMQAMVTYDGVNNPIVITESQALPAPLSDLQRYTLGPIIVGGIVLSQVRSVEVDFGISAAAEGADSDIWPTFASVRTAVPRITLRGIALSWFSATAVPILGRALLHANTSMFLRKRTMDGTFVADGTAEHIKFTLAGYAHVDRPLDISGDDIGECTVILQGRQDGSTGPLIAAVNQVIA